ncbi:hypothetical protein ACFX19_021019 [Malus domestica]
MHGGPYHHRIKDNPKRGKTLVSAAVRVAASRSEQTGVMVFSRERGELWAPTLALLAGNGGGPGFGPLTENCVANLAFSDIPFWSTCMRRFHAYMHHDDHPHTYTPSCPSIENNHYVTR